MADPTVSVVIPFFSDSRQLRRALSSVALQAYPKAEVIVVSDASTEDLSWLGTEFPTVRLIRLTVNGGPGVARNAGVAEARGRYVAFLDSDDWWYPTKLRTQIPLLERSGAAWGHHPFDVVSESGQLLRRVLNQDLEGEVYRATITSFRVQTSCMVFRRELFSEQGHRFAESRIGEDGALYRAVARHHRLHRTPYPLSAFLSHNGNAGFSPAIQLWSRGQVAGTLSAADRRLVGGAPRLGYAWAGWASRRLGLAGPTPPAAQQQRLLAGIAYAPAWLLLHGPTFSGWGDRDA